MYKMQRLEVSGAVRPLYGSLGFKGLISCISCINRMKTEKYYIPVSCLLNLNTVFLLMKIQQWSLACRVSVEHS